MGLIHYLADKLGTDSLSVLVAHYGDLTDENGGIKVSSFKKISDVVRGSIIVGSGEDLGELEDWILEHLEEASAVMKEFFMNINKLSGGTDEKKKETEKSVSES
jgi:hypothetical protein